MKKILNALFLTLLAVSTFSSCSDVPAPYDILGEGDVPGLTGKGTQEKPYTVSDLKSVADGETVAWVQAYIVAGIKSSADKSINSESDVVFGTQPTDVKATAFLIADNSAESDYKNCSAVNLSGSKTGCSDVKKALNLVDNSTTPLPRLVTLKGTLVTNTWGLPGLKEVTTVMLADGTIIGDGGSDTPIDENNPFGLDASNPVSEINADFEEQPDFVQEGTFSSNLNYDYALEGWKNVAFVGDRKWTGVVFRDNTKYIQASANKGSAATYTSWFVSPAFTVDNIKDKTIEFDCAGAYFFETTSLKVYFLELVNGVMQKTEIPVTGIPTSGDNYTWVKGIKIDLSGQTGKIGFIGFEYVAEGGTSKSTTYQIDNIKSGKSEGGGEEVEVVTVTKDAAYEETFKSSFGKFTIDNKDLGGLDAVWIIDTKYDCALAYAHDGTNAVAAESWMVSPVIDLASIQATDNIALTFTHKSQKAGNADEYMLKIKDVTANADWKAIELQQPASNFAATLADIDLKSYAGKKIQIAIVYKNTLIEGTPNKWEIMNLKVGVKVDVPGGTKEDPLTCAEVITLAGGATGDYYVKGYIVGVLTSTANGKFTGPFTVDTNIIIADSANETDVTKCVSVQLPKGDLRTDLNLKSHVDNLGKQILLKGTLVDYYGLNGIKPPKSYEWVN